MSMNPLISITVEIDVPQSHAKAFLAAMTGNDDDVFMVAEKAIRDRLRDVSQDDYHYADEVEIIPPSGRETPRLRMKLREAAEQERWEVSVYGPRA